ncbi:DNA polymerase III subunit delta' [Vibrio porteresiae]|uniref:DNA polymerase III subunit delta' n=1 Tax=Vibrio porteresiae DSM 19223 TaxID=1123496 RepID=A0ABZ0QEU3_9VIBR|nr:DNA polymerase III subunit delta' [Vibrio porteresiae]WPC74983.1 DNA polymerase III subunit delta' [Vibrio porteresiae DSM 19223]
MAATLYPWLLQPWKTWQQRLQSCTFAHATLVHTQQGLGTDELVAQVAKTLMCTSSDTEPCGFCHGCELMQSGTHPDYHEVRPEKEGKTITVDQIRQCNRVALESSQLSGYRLMVIEPAEAMSESAANALLKTLEEPPEKCVFVLVCHQINLLLPTIVSRCQTINVAAPTAHQASEWVATQLNQSIPDYAAHLHDNAPLLTLKFVESDGVKQLTTLEQAFIRSISGDVSAAVECAQLVAQEPLVRLSWLWYLMSDAQKVHFGLLAQDALPGAQALAKHLSYNTLYRQSEALIQLKEQLRAFTGLNAELLITQWLFNINNEDSCL